MGMTVGELRKALEGVDDSMDITVRMTDEEQNVDIVGSLHFATVQTSHDDNETVFFALDGDTYETNDYSGDHGEGCKCGSPCI